MAQAVSLFPTTNSITNNYKHQVWHNFYFITQVKYFSSKMYDKLHLHTLLIKNTTICQNFVMTLWTNKQRRDIQPPVILYLVYNTTYLPRNRNSRNVSESQPTQMFQFKPIEREIVHEFQFIVRTNRIWSQNSYLEYYWTNI